MGLYKPYFHLTTNAEGVHQVCHNCDGGVDFRCADDITDERVWQLLVFAVEEGKRLKTREICSSLGIRQ